MSDLTFVLIASPLLKGLTWQFVAEQLLERGHAVHVPVLSDTPTIPQPTWYQQVSTIKLPEADNLLVGHSGAGALLPAIGERFSVTGYIFVDAVLLFEPSTRLDLMRAEDPEFAQEFERFLQKGGLFPDWKDEHLRELIPDDDLRHLLLEDLRPRGLDFFTEQMDVPASWEKIPCGYIQLSDSYDIYATQAEARGWPVFRHKSHHFDMVTNPSKITKLIIKMCEKLLR